MRTEDRRQTDGTDRDTRAAGEGLRFGSLFSGIGGFDLGFERAGMTCAWQCEIDANARAVLRSHWNTPIIEDVKNVGRDTVEPVDVICGGFPCQDLSVAGKRAGLAGERSGLWFEFHRVLSELRPGWVVIENVPGLLSSNRGRDFAVILQGLADIGYLSAWRVLDAQYFGVAQRRRRVFVVASLGNGRAAEVLFEREGVRWDTPPREKTGEENTGVAGTLASSGAGLDRPSGNGNQLDFCITGTLDHKAAGANRGCQANEADFLVPEYQAFKWGQGEGARGLGEGPVSPTLSSASGGNSIPAIWSDQGGSRMDFDDHVSPTMRAHHHGHPPLVGVRRLTPVECARLQGFPDDWNEGMSDSARYKQFGNAVCGNVAEWIGRRIVEAVKCAAR